MEHTSLITNAYSFLTCLNWNYLLENIEDLNDEELMGRLAKGDRQAFCVLVQRHTQRFYACAYRVCLNQDDAEDAVQDAFLKIWRKPDVWKPDRGAKFTTWFYRIVSNAATDILRKRRNHSGSDVLEYMADENPEQDEEMQRSEEQRGLEHAIGELPERQQQALNLCFYDGFTNKEAAEILGVGVKALESLLMRAKAGLKQTLIDKGLIDEEKKYGS